MKNCNSCSELSRTTEGSVCNAMENLGLDPRLSFIEVEQVPVHCPKNMELNEGGGNEEEEWWYAEDSDDSFTEDVKWYLGS